MLELLMAMVMLNVGILAIVAAFSSGNSALARANRISTAGALANKQMEVYRGIKYDNIVFTTTEWSSAINDSTYTNDTVYQQNMANPTAPKALVSAVTNCPANVPTNACDPSYTTTGADHQLVSRRHVSLLRHAELRQPAPNGDGRRPEPGRPDAHVLARHLHVRSLDRSVSPGLRGTEA